jgi:hypothetical protein
MRKKHLASPFPSSSYPTPDCLHKVVWGKLGFRSIALIFPKGFRGKHSLCIPRKLTSKLMF